ncbi:MAG: hypothetical protein Q8868_02695 [Bacteroidota bacterium]|nr:hypothetical protein [Bacteroidota bacterium]
MRSTWILISLILGFTVVSGQEQSRVIMSIAQKLNSYCSKIPREEIYVHTDRNDYVAGEEIWFRAYLIDRKSSELSSGSRIAYFEVLNPESRPVVQKRILLRNGAGPGQAQLPDTLSTGTYIIRAYTNWMKNFLPYNCFMSKVYIYNPFRTKARSVKLTELTFNRGITTTGKQGNVQTEGFSLSVGRTGQNDLDVSINTTRNYRSVSGTTCYMVIQTHGVINVQRPVNLVSDSTSVAVPVAQLLPGINQITIFNSLGRPVAERCIYTPANSHQPFSISAPDIIRKREKIALDMLVTDKRGNDLIPVGLSVSVAPLTENPSADIAEYMIFGTEFGFLPDELSEAGPDNIPAEKLDAFLSGLRSNWIDWNNILSDKLPDIKYGRETENHFLHGRLINKNTQAPDVDKYLFLSIPGKKAYFQYAKTDADGDFFFTLPIDEKIMDLIIQPEDMARNDNIKIESSFSNIYPELHFTRDTSAQKISSGVSKLGINYQVKKIYSSEEAAAKSQPESYIWTNKNFYGKPDIKLMMDDYIKLPVMQEVFFELMPGVFLRKKKAEYEISIADPVENRIYDRPPMLLVDGVIINDASVIANLDPEHVEEIDAIKERYFVGDYLFFGLVNVITRTGDFSNITLPDNAVRLPYRVVDPVKSFNYPVYDTQVSKQSRIPDLRNTLYWNPSVETDAGGKARIEFWTSDFTTDYVINIQGMTSDGKAITFTKTLKLQQ